MSAPPARTGATVAASAGHGMSAHDEPHLPHGSIWPFVLGVSVALLGIGILLFGAGFKAAHHPDIDPLTGEAGEHPVAHFGEIGVGSYLMLAIGLAAVVGALLGWFFEDYRWWNTNTGTGLATPKAGTLLFISSEVFLFGALFTNYFAFQNLAHAAGSAWPDVMAEGGHAFELPILKTGLFTLFLFASSGTLHVSEGHLKAGRHRQFVTWWGITILLGLVFLAGQVWEYANLIHEGHTLGSSQFMTAFFILTGTHGLHVFAGLVMLTVMWVRAAKGQFTPQRHAGPQVAGIYWHFVDLVWVFVFTFLYVLPYFHLA